MSRPKSGQAEAWHQTFRDLVGRLGTSVPAEIQRATAAESTDAVRKWKSRGVPPEIFERLDRAKSGPQGGYVARGFLFSSREFLELPEAVQLRVLEMIERGELTRGGIGRAEVVLAVRNVAPRRSMSDGAGRSDLSPRLRLVTKARE